MACRHCTASAPRHTINGDCVLLGEEEEEECDGDNGVDGGPLCREAMIAKWKVSTVRRGKKGVDWT
jgi:hypothetical protein